LGVSNNDVIVTLVASLRILFSREIAYRPVLFFISWWRSGQSEGIAYAFVWNNFHAYVRSCDICRRSSRSYPSYFLINDTPTAIAHLFAKRPKQGIMISIFIALIAMWLGIFISFYEPYQMSFFITSIVFVLYIITLIFQKIKANSKFIT